MLCHMHNMLMWHRWRPMVALNDAGAAFTTLDALHTRLAHVLITDEVSQHQLS